MINLASYHNGFALQRQCGVQSDRGELNWFDDMFGWFDFVRCETWDELKCEMLVRGITRNDLTSKSKANFDYFEKVHAGGT